MKFEVYFLQSGLNEINPALPHGEICTDIIQYDSWTDIPEDYENLRAAARKLSEGKLAPKRMSLHDGHVARIVGLPD